MLSMAKHGDSIDLVSDLSQIRIFGDPLVHHRSFPILDICITVDLDSPAEELVREISHDVVGDFVEGFMFGDAIGIGLRSASGWWTITSVSYLPEPHVEASY